jgi:hypothetical protein
LLLASLPKLLDSTCQGRKLSGKKVVREESCQGRKLPGRGCQEVTRTELRGVATVPVAVVVVVGVVVVRVVVVAIVVVAAGGAVVWW